MNFKEKQEVRKDQAILEHLVNKYGKDDVLQYINEGRFADFARRIGKGIANMARTIKDWAVNVAKAINSGDLPTGVSVVLANDAAAVAGVDANPEDGRAEIQNNIAEDIKECENFWDNYMKTANVSESYMNKLHKKWQRLNEAKATPSSEFLKLEAPAETKVPDCNTAELKSNIKFRLRKRFKLGDAVGKDDVLLIWGAPGIGKTAIVNQMLLDLQEEEQKKLSLIDTRLASMDYDDFFLPAVNRNADNEAKESVDLPKAWLPVYRLGSDEENIQGNAEANASHGSEFGGVLFFDEFSRANHATMNVLMKFVDERQLGEYRLGDRWSMIAAANRESDMADTDDFHWEPAFGRRFTQYNFVPTFNEWIDWAKNEGHLRQDIIEFLETYPDHWYEAVKSEGATATGMTPASWTKTSKLWDDREQFDYDFQNMDDEQKNKLKITDLKGAGGREIFREGHKGVEYDMDDYLNVFRNFPKSACRKVWTAGDTVAPNFVQTAGNIAQVVKAIFVERPNKKDKELPTPNEWENLFKFVIQIDNPSLRAMAYTNMIELFRNNVDPGFLPNMPTVGGKPNPYYEVSKKYLSQLGQGFDKKGGRI